MSKPACICPMATRTVLALLLAALALAPAACRKQTPPAAQPTASVNTEPLTGEVHPFMTSQLQRFIAQMGRPPTNFTELASSSLDVVPRSPPGMTWAIDYATKEVKLVRR